MTRHASDCPADTNDFGIRSADLPLLQQRLRTHLFDHVMPFWRRYAFDERGGLHTCLDNHGRVQSGDKWLWSQWRAVWVFSKLHLIDDRHNDWLGWAEHCLQFCEQQGWIDNLGWALRVCDTGRVINGFESIYVNLFALYGLTAYHRASGDPRAETLARQTADVTLTLLQKPHDQIPHFPYPIPAGARVHGIPMIACFAFWEAGQHFDKTRYRNAAVALSDEVMHDFYRPARDLVLERISADGSEYPPPLGTAVNPGHVIESLWFQIHIAADRGDTARIAECCRLIRRHLEVGWDDEYGGIRLAIDADGAETVGWDHADTKLWWPHTEALYALLLAYEHIGDAWCLDWFDRVADFTFSRFPQPQGEWIQKLSRTGQPIDDVVALPVKDPFHLPRALILSLEVLGRLNASASTRKDTL